MASMEKGKNPQTHNHSVMMIFIIWNTRGANSSSFRRHCDLMVKTYRSSILVLLEIKMVEHKELTEELQFDAQIQSAANRAAGSIVIIWKEGELKLDNISITP